MRLAAVGCGPRRPGTRRPGVAAARRALSTACSRSWSAAAEDDFEAARTGVRLLGRTIVHVGTGGAGQTVKAANQLVVGGTYALVAEAIVLLEASGVDAGPGLDVLAGGLAGSRILELKRKSMVAREFAPGFRIDLHHKDMGIASTRPARPRWRCR